MAPAQTKRVIADHVKAGLPPTFHPHPLAHRPNRSSDKATFTALPAALNHLELPGKCITMLFVDYSPAFDAIIPDMLAVRPSNVDFPSQPLVHESEASSLPVHKVRKQALSLFLCLSLPPCSASNAMETSCCTERGSTSSPVSQPSDLQVFVQVQISEDLCWSANSSEAVKKAQRRLHFLNRLREKLLVSFCSSTVDSVLLGVVCWLLCKGSCLTSSRCLCRAKSIIKDCSQAGHKLF